jgi:hypothetical protein
MSISTLRPRSPTEAVDAALRLAGGHFGSYVSLNALITLPAVAYWVLNFDAIATPQGMAADHYRTIFIVLAVNTILGSLASAAVVTAMSEVYLGRALRLADAVRRVLPRAPALIVAVIMRWTLVFLGLTVGILLLFFPGIYIGARTACLEAVAVLDEDRRGPFGIFGRTWSLAEAEVSHLFLTMLLVLLIFFAGYAVAEVAARLVGAGIPLMDGLRARRLVQTALMLFVQPILPAATTVLYYDLRVRKEALDLELMAGALETPAP